MGLLTAVVAAAVALLVIIVAGWARQRTLPRRLDRGKAPRVKRYLRRFARRERLSDDVVADWCEELARRVRAGASLAGATRSAAAAPALAPILAPITLALERGASLATATRRVNSADAGIGIALAVVRVCAELGGPAALPLDRAATTLRARATDRADRHVHSAQARLSAIVLTVLPGAALVLLLATNPQCRAAVTTPAGIGCVGAGAVLNAIGWWLMQQIVGRSR